MLKKIFICFFVLSFICIVSKSSASASTKNTGHTNVIELGFYEENLGYKLLSETSDKEIENAYKKVKRKIFGWNKVTINNNLDAWYISEIIFSKSNRSTQTFTFVYNTKQSVKSKQEYSVSGSLSTKASGKIKGITLGGDIKGEGELKNSSEEYFEEKTNFSVDLKPYTKLSLMIRGDCIVSSGVGKNYFLGIQIEKGTWEYINFVTEYYEFLEEEL